MKTIQNLNGTWEYRVGKGAFRPIAIPFSALPVGHSECRRTFDLCGEGEKVWLKFDGITYAADVYLNGRHLGHMGPYCEYEFDITSIARPTDNELLVELEDIAPKFGPTAGWENFGGIIRDVTVVYAPANRIENVFAHSVLCDDYTAANLTVETACTVPAQGQFEVRLSYEGETVLSYVQPANEAAVPHRVSDIRLWSLDTPCLYQLDVALTVNGQTVDAYTANVGFRELTCDKQRFYFNGQPIFLKGVCKHEMVGESGHCPTEEQMEADMRRIKETGCNFVRLVHYPHNKRMLDIADRLGLLVSEEPGLWWSDTADPDVSAGSIEVLKRTILRDRNHACVAFWLCFNECHFTEQFLIDSAAACRQYDPTRMVSGANCMNDQDTLKYYNLCGFDFYTMHPYAPTLSRPMESARVLCDKPLLFTEWGGYYVYDNPHLLTEFFQGFNDLYRGVHEGMALAGAFFWFWAELNDFNRGKPACVDGNLAEGLLHSDRTPTLIYEAFREGMALLGTAPADDPFWYSPRTDRRLTGTNLLKDVPCDSFTPHFQQLADAHRAPDIPRRRNLKVGPVLQQIVPLNDTPLLLDDGREIHIHPQSPIAAHAVTVVGLVCLDKGYPLSGAYSEPVATLRMIFEDGGEQTYTFKNGEEVTTVFTTNLSSRINPVAQCAETIADFGYEKNFEQYLLHAVDIPVTNTTPIKEVRLTSCNNGYGLLLYGILV